MTITAPYPKVPSGILTITKAVEVQLGRKLHYWEYHNFAEVLPDACADYQDNGHGTLRFNVASHNVTVNLVE